MKSETFAKSIRLLCSRSSARAKKNGLNATAHVFYYDDVKELLESGIYGIEHGILDRDIGPDDPIVAL